MRRTPQPDQASNFFAHCYEYLIKNVSVASTTFHPNSKNPYRFFCHWKQEKMCQTHTAHVKDGFLKDFRAIAGFPRFLWFTYRKTGLVLYAFNEIFFRESTTLTIHLHRNLCTWVRNTCGFDPLYDSKAQ
jgi:hypothetical protein